MASISANKREYDAFEHLCSSLFLSDESVVAVLTGYFDESGTHTNQNVHAPTLAVGGYVSRFEQWVKFNAEWIKALDEAGIPFFHMKDFEARQTKDGKRIGVGFYESWTPEKREPFYRELCRLIKWYTLTPAVSAVVVPDYEEVINGDYHKLLGSPYAFNAQACWRMIGNWAIDNKVDEPINYVYELGAGYNSELTNFHAQTYANEFERRRMRLGFIGWGDKKSVRPLQAADIHVHQSRLRTINHLDPKAEKIFRARFKGIAQWWHQKRYILWGKKELTGLKAWIDREGSW